MSIRELEDKLMHEDDYKPRRKDDYDDSNYDSRDLNYK